MSSIAMAHEGAVDEFGCHVDPVSTSYHCSTGPLKDLEFVSKEEAKEALNKQQKIEEDEFQVTTTKDPMALGDSGEKEPVDEMTVISWPLSKKVERLDYDRMASAVAKAQMIIFQDVEFNEHGDTPVNVFASILEKREGQRVCRGWMKNARGERGRFAFVWFDEVIGAISSSGQMQKNCGLRPVVFRSELKAAGVVTFMLKSNGRVFHLASVHPEKSGVAAEREVKSLFQNFPGSEWAVILGGDFIFSPKSKVMSIARKGNFKPAFGRDMDHENFWFKNVSSLNATRINLQRMFPELQPKAIAATLSPSSPMRFELSFAEAGGLETQLVSRGKKGKGPASIATPKPEEPKVYPTGVEKHEFADLKEDVEAEEGAVVARDASSDSSQTPVAKKAKVRLAKAKSKVKTTAKSKAKKVRKK